MTATPRAACSRSRTRSVLTSARLRGALSVKSSTGSGGERALVRPQEDGRCGRRDDAGRTAETALPGDKALTPVDARGPRAEEDQLAHRNGREVDDVEPASDRRRPDEPVHGAHHLVKRRGQQTAVETPRLTLMLRRDVN